MLSLPTAQHMLAAVLYTQSQCFNARLGDIRLANSYIHYREKCLQIQYSKQSQRGTIIDAKCYNLTSCGDLDVGAGYGVVHEAVPGLHPLLALRLLGLEVGGGALAGRRRHARLGVRVLGVVIAVWSVNTSYHHVIRGIFNYIRASDFCNIRVIFIAFE